MSKNNKFVLMQDPVKWTKIGKIGYFAIGLKELYPGKGFSDCDEFGITDYIGPFAPSTAKFAFLDEESKNQFKGEIKYERELDIYFAIIKKEK